MSRRKPPDTQASLFAATPPAVVRDNEPKRLAGCTIPSMPAPVDAPERPKLRLVHSVAEWDVTVEATDEPDVFYVTRMRDSGTASSAMLFTRAQLERLIARASAALKIT